MDTIIGLIILAGIMISYHKFGSTALDTEELRERVMAMHKEMKKNGKL